MGTKQEKKASELGLETIRSLPEGAEPPTFPYDWADNAPEFLILPQGPREKWISWIDQDKREDEPIVALSIELYILLKQISPTRFPKYQAYPYGDVCQTLFDYISAKRHIFVSSADPGMCWVNGDPLGRLLGVQGFTRDQFSAHIKRQMLILGSRPKRERETDPQHEAMAVPIRIGAPPVPGCSPFHVGNPIPGFSSPLPNFGRQAPILHGGTVGIIAPIPQIRQPPPEVRPQIRGPGVQALPPPFPRPEPPRNPVRLITHSSSAFMEMQPQGPRPRIQSLSRGQTNPRHHPSREGPRRN